MAIINYLQFNVISQPDPKNPSNIITQLQLGGHGLFSGGVVMDLLIGIDTITARTLQASNVPIPSPIIVKGLLDTGCTITSIDKSLATKLNLVTRGFSQSGTANGVATFSQHLISIGFPGTNLRGNHVHTVQAIDLSNQPIQVLIGRDLMSAWTITYNGMAGFVSIAD